MGELNEREEDAGQNDVIDVVTRRQFLEVLAASFAALSTAGCKLKAPREKVIPYLEQPEENVAGLASWYASTCGGCPAACGILAKSRDGRPIKLEGNPEHPLSRGGLCARGQATVLDLYDSQRLKGPLSAGATASWAEVDAAIEKGLSRGGEIRIVGRTVPSPSLDAAVKAFEARHPSGRRVVYDPVSASSIVEAHRRTHGRAVLPHYHFDRAKAIVSFDADFLGTWLSPVEFTRDWAANRAPDNEWGLMSWHAQIEPRMSATGANADWRAALKPSLMAGALAAVGREVARQTGFGGPLPAAAPAGLDAAAVADLTSRLLAAKGRSLVVSGSTDADVQVLVNWLNAMLGNYGSTIDLDRPSRQAQGGDAAMDRLIAEMAAGRVSALIVLDGNPAYDHPRAEEFSRAMKAVPLTVALCERKDETAALARYVCPVPHFLESWGDAEPVAGVHSLIQPVLSPLFDSRPAIESLLRWSGDKRSAYDFIRERWRAELFQRQTKFRSFSAFWDDSVRRGTLTIPSKEGPAPRFEAGSLLSVKPGRRSAEGFELAAYASVALYDGRQANNPWLQELPDPVTRACWGNYASFSPEDAAKLGIEEGRVVELSSGGRKLQLPAHVQPGQARGVVAAALGYGRAGAGAIAANYPMVKMLPLEKDLLAGADLYPMLGAGAVSVSVGGRRSPLAKVQTYDFLADPIFGQKRPFVLQTTLEDYYRNPREANPEPPGEEESLWPRHKYEGHKWGMAIDLNACTGCSACVIACQAENNVPVVGKAEVRKSRDMAWIRIDRYFEGKPGEVPESPEVSFEPMLCQHCDNAPCETVCPVLATVHSTEGLNMQVYNRCVGTRYCGNNCPFKVRRFNWFDYARQDLLQNLALNPDVTVRSRGVMEKCSFCVQRIYSAKFQAKEEGRPLKDGDAVPACAQSCPAQAIVFGDMNDPESRVAKLAKESRSYRVLSELGVGPSVLYRMKIRNKA